MPLLRRSEFHRLLEPGQFLWAAGIEDTFITAPWPKTGRTLDEYELTQHYERWHADLGLMREIGVQGARYGIPWHRIQPRAGVWEWDFVDRAVDRLLELGIEPIIDLVHYGLPPWIEGAYLHRDFPHYMADYAARTAGRLKGRVFSYTPLNEPRITAWYCGRLGWWPPHRRGWRGFVAVMLAACRGIVEASHALTAVDADILLAHVDATDLYTAEDPRQSPAAEQRQEIVFLALDLVSGRMTPESPLWPWLLRHGATEAELGWFRARPVELPLVGLNLYPMFTRKVLRRRRSGELRWTMPYADARIVTDLGRMYWERYGAPVFISETAAVGAVARRRAWLNDSLAAVKQLRESGVPMVGYTWWPLFALVTWGYRQGTHPPPFYLKQMGLWDLDAKLDRVPTPLVGEFRRRAEAGTAHIGELGEHAFAISPGGTV
ncbi:MAG: glycoside hydrolase [Opitutus sp.]|nr:glycoside hydrolase [Opitutus sp.]